MVDAKQITSLAEMKKRLTDAFPEAWRQFSMGGQTAYAQAKYIKDPDEWREFNAAVLEILGSSATYKGGYYSLSLVNAAKTSSPPSPPKPTVAAKKPSIDEMLQPSTGPTRTGLPKTDAKLEAMEAKKEGFKMLPLSKLTTSPVKVRQSVDAEFVKELSISVKGKGVLQPILVRPLESGDYQIVMGEQRYRAAKEAGQTEIPCIVKNMNDREAFEAGLEENLKRKDLSDYEVAKALQYMLKRFPDEFPNQKILAFMLGKSEDWVSRHLAILEFEGKIAPVRLKEFTSTQATELRQLPEEKQKEVIEEVVKTGEIPSKRTIEAHAKAPEVKGHSVEDAEKPEELGPHTQDKVCPVCGRAVAPSIYEKLKQQFSGFGGLFQ